MQNGKMTISIFLLCMKLTEKRKFADIRLITGRQNVHYRKFPNSPASIFRMASSFGIGFPNR